MASDRTVSLHVPRAALWTLGFLLIAPWLAFVVWRLSGSSRTDPKAAAATPTAATKGAWAGSDVMHARQGPWGDVEYFRILIEPPEEFILSDYIQADVRPWIFKGFTDAQLAALWDSAGLDAAQKSYLSDPAHREVRADAILIHPDRSLVVGLSPAARARIYSSLGDFPENFSQFNPYRLRSSAAGGWLDNADLPAEAVALTKRMFYQRGTATCFSDESIVLPTIKDAADRARYIKALSRKSALVVQLKIRPGEDVEPLVSYWGQSGRSKDLKPLLQSLARRPNGGAIDILHLLPRFARLHAYTYPLPSEKSVDANHDCHWTAFNFQNEEIDERLSDINYVGKVLAEQYYPVPGNPRLGDLIMFVRGDGVVLHSCVYIADDIVFTKNGPSFSVPWLIASLADVEAFYAATPGVEMRRYRLKNQ